MMNKSITCYLAALLLLIVVAVQAQKKTTSNNVSVKHNGKDTGVIEYPRYAGNWGKVLDTPKYDNPLKIYSSSLVEPYFPIITIGHKTTIQDSIGVVAIRNEKGTWEIKDCQRALEIIHQFLKLRYGL